MRRRTVRSGLIMILAGVALITTATFYHGHIAGLFVLSDASAIVSIFLILAAGGIACCIGIMVSFIGLLLKSGDDRDVGLSHVIVLVAASVAIFFLLFFISISANDQPGMKPGEYITI